jgi:Domain of unknown function (DUF5667)
MNYSMDSDEMHDRDVVDMELAQRLEAYAEARLSPSLSATSRMRTQVMAAAHRQAALAQADANRTLLAAADIAARPTAMRRPAWRRPVSALLAACLILALAVSSVAAARPGGPLYGARIWVETLTLPTSAAERASAEVRRLNERLAEVDAAMRAGDTNAADAALSAYNAIVSEATAGTNGNAAANATLDTAVRHNIEVLTLLAGSVPDPARDAIEHAIQQSSSAVNGPHGNPGVGGQPSTNPGKTPQPGTTNRPEHSANPNNPTPTPAVATPQPPEDATPKPHPTPKPQVTPEPDAATPTPGHTPKADGKPSSPPGAGN